MRAAELADGTTGKQLWGRRQYSPRPVASITKLMTALVVVQSRHLSRRIKITAADIEYARAHDAASAGLRPGDVLTARQLLCAMLLLGEAAMRRPVIRDVVARRRYLLRAGPHHHGYRWLNTNLLLGRYPGAIGIKTGWTPSAGLHHAVRMPSPPAGGNQE